MGIQRRKVEGAPFLKEAGNTCSRARTVDGRGGCNGHAGTGVDSQGVVVHCLDPEVLARVVRHLKAQLLHRLAGEPLRGSGVGSGRRGDGRVARDGIGCREPRWGQPRGKDAAGKIARARGGGAEVVVWRW